MVNKKFYIKTLGCKVNQYESQAMREILVSSGFVESEEKAEAGIYIVNTCTVTGDADKESRYLIKQFRRMNPSAKIVVTGCYVEKNADEVSSLPGVRHILKNIDKSRIAEYLDERPTTDDRLTTRLADQLKITGFRGHAKAFVKIQDGCENYCSYCKVPFVRGPFNSKPLPLIVKEVAGLVGNGFKEIVLTGICLGAWGAKMPGDAGMPDVLRALEDVEGDYRIRLSSIEPKYVTDRLINYIAQNGRICPHLHIPLQSGDDGILKKMNRSYTSEDYMTMAGRIRSVIKGVSITTDVVIGFPGETESSFDNTLQFIKKLSPLKTHIFTYSKREGTAAYSLPGELDKRLLKEMHEKLAAAASAESHRYRKRYTGRVLNVLVETRRDRESNLLEGYSDNYIKVFFDGPDNIMKTIAPVKVREVDFERTYGEYPA